MNEKAVLSQTKHPVSNQIGGVFMHVSNMEKSVNWYHRLFGMPERSSVTDKVHSVRMDGGSDFVLDQHGYDRGLATEDRPILMFESPDVHAAYRFVQKVGIPIEWEIEEYPGMAFFTIRDPDRNLLMICGAPGTKEELEADTDQRSLSHRYDGGGTWLSVTPTSSHSLETTEGLELTGRAITEAAFATPLRLETTVKIDNGCLRLEYGPHGQLTFNYGPSATSGVGEEFYVTHPKVHKQYGFPTKGALPTGEWIRVEWTIHERKMEVHVNGRLYHVQEGYFGDLVGKAGIGCDNGRITVKSYSVESLSERETSPRLPIYGNGAQTDALAPDVSCYPSMTGEGLWLTCDDQWGRALSEAVYAAPFVMEVVLRADMHAFVLYGGVAAQVKFHANGALSFRDPVSKEEVWTENAGQLPDGFTTIRWEMHSDRTTVSVDGEVRFERAGDYANCRFRLGVGSDLGSAVTVKSVHITC